MHVFALAALSLGLAVGLASCNSAEVHFRGGSTTALERLGGRAGPVRFARVTDRVFRGGQPSRRHLEELHAAGVTTIIDLRAEDRGARRDEEREARRLGMHFVHYPFDGLRGVDDAFLSRVVAAMGAADNGRVYVHCKLGRDRTSLLIALYRVIEQGWDPDVAWRREALAYGHRPIFFFRKFGAMYRRMVRNQARAESATAPASSFSPDGVSSLPRTLRPSGPASPPGSASSSEASTVSAGASSS